MSPALGQNTFKYISGLLALALLAGCAPIPGSPTEPKPSLATSTQNYTQIGGSPVDAVPLSMVPDMSTVDQSDEHRHIFTQHFKVTSVPAVGEAQRGLVELAMGKFDQGNVPDVSAGLENSGELNIRSYLTAVSPNVLGIRTAAYQSVDSVGSNRFLTQWFDTRKGSVLGSRDLFDSADDWADFREFVAQTAASNPLIAPESVTQLEDAWLDSVNFDAQGNATVELDDAAITAGTAQSVVVTVSASNIIPLLSPFGLMARTAGMAPTPRLPAISAVPWGNPEEPEDPAVPAPPSGEEKTVDCTKAKCVALTFDDGPGPKTGKLLYDLKKADAPATFFVVGPNAKTRPELLKRMIAEGHEVGNHTWTHRSLTALSPANIRSEIDRTNEVISAAIDQPATLLRPPYGAHNSTSDRLAQTPVILWDVDTLDWKHKNADKVVSSALSQTRPGSIVLMHDIHSTTVAAVPRILAGLKAKGYTFVTVTELLGKDKLKSGETYLRAPSTAKGSVKNGGKK